MPSAYAVLSRRKDMAISIRSNIASLNAQRNLTQTQNQLNNSLERLSSGYRINRAGDDAAGLAISESMKSQIRGLHQAERNANDGISLLQTAEGALSEVSNILIRMRELSVQAVNGSLTGTDRGYLNTEFDNLRNEITRIANVTEFNGTALLNADSNTFSFQVGIKNDGNSQIKVELSSMTAATAGLNLNSSRITGQTVAQTTIDSIDSAIGSVSSLRATIGASQNSLSTTIANLSTNAENLTAANSRIRDVDVAKETSEMTRQQILVQAGISVLAQANQAPQTVLQLLG